MSESSRRKNAPDLPRRISLKMEVKQVKQTPNTLALTKRHQLRQNQKLQKLLTETQLQKRQRSQHRRRRKRRARSLLAIKQPL